MWFVTHMHCQCLCQMLRCSHSDLQATEQVEPPRHWPALGAEWAPERYHRRAALALCCCRCCLRLREGGTPCTAPKRGHVLRISLCVFGVSLAQAQPESHRIPAASGPRAAAPWPKRGQGKAYGGTVGALASVVNLWPRSWVLSIFSKEIQGKGAEPHKCTGHAAARNDNSHLFFSIPSAGGGCSSDGSTRSGPHRALPHGTARHSTPWHGMARQHGKVRHRSGNTRSSMARHGTPQHSTAP